MKDNIYVAISHHIMKDFMHVFNSVTRAYIEIDYVEYDDMLYMINNIKNKRWLFVHTRTIDIYQMIIIEDQ
jgi:hypothetical protein